MAKLHLPDFVLAHDEEAKTVTVETALQAISLGEMIPDDYGVIVNDPVEERKMRMLMMFFGVEE